jgi:hypothetical protein
MAKKPKADQITMFRDETAVIPAGDVSYWLLLDDDEVEALASGRCPKRITERAWGMLSWRRTANQDWASYNPTKKAVNG